MINDHRTGVEVQSNVEGEKIALSIDVSAMGHIMQVLTDLYSDPETAVIREYATNAYDAHVEAGNSDPIEVTLPNALSPFLTIKDYGVGLSFEDIRDIFSKYGASTKRETNDQVGTLGLGCKSALTYVNQFTLVGIKNGERVQVMISRDEEGSGSMTIVDRSPTDEPTGVEVVVPVKRHNDMQEKAEIFFSYWEPGTVLVNGEEPESIQGLEVDKNTLIVEDGMGDRVVMGNVPYPVEGRLAELNGRDLVVRVPIGSIHFTPSREGLRDTPVTVQTLDKIRDGINEKIGKAIEKDIDKAATPYAALKAMVTWRQIARGSGDLRYKGRVIPYNVELENPTVVNENSYRLSDHSKPRDGKVGVSALVNGVIIFGYDRDKFTPWQRKKLDKWTRENDVDAKTWILVEDKPYLEWIDPDRFYEWEEVRATKLPRQGGNGGAKVSAGYYQVYTNPTTANTRGLRGQTIPAEEIKGPNLFFCELNRGYSYELKVAKLFNKYTIVELAGNRVRKFKRLFPKAKPVREALQEKYQKWEDSLSEDDKLALAIQQQSSYGVSSKQLDPSRIDDPDIRKWAELAKRGYLTGPSNNAKLYLEIGRPQLPSINDPIKKYPLIDSYYDLKHHADHAYIYMNAVYAERNK